MAGKVKNSQGPSLYYATDKNVFDALNQHKINAETISQLFIRRNIIVSNKTYRENLAKYFSTLTHDYYDHQRISARLGVVPRRERTTSMEVAGIENIEDLNDVVSQLKRELEANGDIVNLSKENGRLRFEIQYSEIDYRKTEFSQIQIKDGVIEFVKSDNGFVVRNTQNDYVNNIREMLLYKAEKILPNPLRREIVSMFDIPSSKHRTRFFYDLANGLPGYSRRDVTDVYVFKPRPDNSKDEELQDDIGIHVERVFLRGKGVSRSELLNDLLEVDEYYIIKIGWVAAELLGAGHEYEIEAAFSDVTDCTGFSFILKGVYHREEDTLSLRRRAPNKHEIDTISRVVENKAREIVAKLRAEYIDSQPGE